jgi:hypothetical protein
MSITYTSPVTGAAQTGLTSPTYTVVADNAPPGNPGEQVAVTALGGTQTGVVAHSISVPFTTNTTRPATYKVLGQPNPTTGVIANVPKNVHKVITRKGVLPLAGQPYAAMIIETIISVPAGSDTADPANIRAALSMHLGVLAQQSAGIGDLVINGVL